jgi:negative regulator of flagellin synthesis FlgM
MKIGNPADKPAPAPAGHAATAKADASATLALSTAASSLLSGSSSAEFDAEKVARISKAIEDGSFKVDPEAIADKLLANAQELLGRFQS